MDWFPRFLADHVRRNPHSQMPNARTDAEGARVFFDAWREAFRREAVTEAEAVEASTWMAAGSDSFPGQHLRLLVGRIVVRRFNDASDAGAESRQQAMARNAKEVEEHRASLQTWQALPEARRERIRADVARDHPAVAAMGNERFLTLCCLAELQTRLGSEEGGAP